MEAKELSLLEVAKTVLELDKAGMIHRDPLDTDKEFEQLRIAIAQAESPWIPVAERKPDELVFVLAGNDITDQKDVAYWDGEDWQAITFHPTHWMPIPPLAKETP